MKINKKFKVGNAYWITFLDHTMGMKGIVNVQVMGWCLEDNADCVVLSAWQIDHHDKDLVDNNHEPFSVVKSTIKRKKLLNGV